MKFRAIGILPLIMILIPQTLHAEVKQSGPDGFSVVLERETELGADEAYRMMVEDFSTWYDASHSYSGKAENLSLDLERHCFFEKLPDGGFVRHMEILFHQPGNKLIMSGGLGPLMPMGVSGALTFDFVGSESGTKIRLTYNVTGASHQQLDRIATPVNGVLAIQLDRLKQHLDSKIPASAAG